MSHIITDMMSHNIDTEMIYSTFQMTLETLW